MNKVSNGKKTLMIIAIAVCLLLLIFGIAMKSFHVSTVHVRGNSYYTDDEIRNMLLGGKFSYNSLYLKLRYARGIKEDFPFIERADISFDSANEITITVYEKSIAGCVSYLGRYMYFDKDGIIVESSTDVKEGIPVVKGLKFEQCVMGELLPVSDTDVFKEILSLTQLLNKYSIVCDGIYFPADGTITLYFDKARVYIGTMDNIDEKMIKLQYIVPKLEGLSGVLHLENYDGENKDEYITFETED
ncbi:MAG: FtsQ-type POTRA domain-containing protein [Lachnospiraceae bacterium]|nr:FtsQ-type POTRA domain-containing protein [Lachnospiraceae bacterium]